MRALRSYIPNNRDMARLAYRCVSTREYLSLGLVAYPDVPRIYLTITADTNNYNLFAAAGSPTRPVRVILTIAAGVIVGSTSTGTHAFDTGTGWHPATTILVINNGTIMGKGGAGGAGGTGGLSCPKTCSPAQTDGGTTGGTGGPAFRAQRQVFVLNNGAIGGGGGGGGGGGSAGSSWFARVAGGGGGGGGQGSSTAASGGAAGGAFGGISPSGGGTGSNGSTSSPGGGAGGGNSAGQACGGSGGSGGGLGQAGSSGGGSPCLDCGGGGGCWGSSPAGGGAAGAATVGDSFIVFTKVGTIAGNRT